MSDFTPLPEDHTAAPAAFSIHADWTPSADQATGLDKIGDWLKNDTSHKPFFVLHGPAGAGKTKFATKVAELWNGPIVPMAFSGKAANVMRRKGMPATTIHRKIYLPQGEKQAEVQELELDLQTETDPARIRKIRRRLEVLYQPKFVVLETAQDGSSVFPSNSLIVLDECSMVSHEIAEDLISFGRPILVLGDPFQLPPVKGTGYFDAHPDFLLTTIHRQALESPVIYLATQAREGKTLYPGAYGDSLITYRKKVDKEMVLGVDQLISGSNKARVQLNNESRGFRGCTDMFPQKGERLICLRNNAQTGILNGQIFETLEDAEHDADKGNLIWLTVQEVDMENAPILRLKVHKECFEEPEVIKSWSYPKRSTAEEFDFSYCVTCHKFQGSEAPSVLGWADMWRWESGKTDFARWSYSTITRASDRIIFAL